MEIKASILISSFNRINLLRRSLWSIANRPPSVPFEVILADDGSSDDILGELKLYSFPWTFIRFDANLFASQTGIKKYFNNPSATNNAAFSAVSPTSEHIFQQGNECIATGDVYDQLIEFRPRDTEHYAVMSTTYDIPPHLLHHLGRYGSEIDHRFMQSCHRWPLQSHFYRSDVTNYLSLASRRLWETIGGYDERFVAGIACEDSDYIRRARALPNFKMVISDAVSLHQSHGGKNVYGDPAPEVISRERWDRGVAINRRVYGEWDGTPGNPQGWPPGQTGVVEVIRNARSARHSA